MIKKKLLFLAVLLVCLVGCSTFETVRYFSSGENAAAVEMETTGRYAIIFGKHSESVAYEFKGVKVGVEVGSDKNSYIHTFGPIFLPIIPVFNFFQASNEDVYLRGMYITFNGDNIESEIDFSEVMVVSENINYPVVKAKMYYEVYYSETLIRPKTKEIIKPERELFKAYRSAYVYMLFDIPSPIDVFVFRTGKIIINGGEFKMPDLIYKKSTRKIMGIFSGPA